MKTSITLIFLLFYTLFLLFLPENSKAQSGEEIKEIAVVVNPANKIGNLTSKQISEIFLSRRRTFPSGESVVVLEHDWNCSLREKFFRLLNGMTLKRLNAYWVRLQFSGEVQPPPIMPDNIAMRNAVSQNRNA
ncbi:MAG: hypothetical protein AB7U45_16165, partial [Desulfamplus sp.]